MTEPPAPVDPSTVPELQGVFAPVHHEHDERDLSVTGTLPDDLVGTYVRNGPNAAYPPVGSYTWPFDGDAMLHAVDFAAGRASYRNRFVWTDELRQERDAGRALWGGFATGEVPGPGEVPEHLAGRPKVRPFIHAVHHAGRWFACAEAQTWYEVAPDLATIGPVALHPTMTRLCAHPKVDPVTGEMVVFAYDWDPPHLRWGVVGADGTVTTPMQPLDVPDVPLMVHDFAITEHHLLFVLGPLIFDPLDRLGVGRLAWQPDRGTTIAVVPRPGVAGEVRTFEVDAFWVWHFANAFEDGQGRIVADLPRLDHWLAEVEGQCQLVRLTVDLAAGTVHQAAHDDRFVEFSRIDDRLCGRPHPWFVAAAKSPGSTTGGDVYDQVVRVDGATGTVTARQLPAGVHVAESIFAPRRGGGPGEGYVLTYAYDQDRTTTDLLVLDADDIAGEPVAVVHLPVRVPVGLHGSFLSPEPGPAPG